MTDTKYSMKMEKQFKSKRAGTLLAAIVLLIGIVTAGMILITIPTVNAEDEITFNQVTDQIIDISDKYNSAGITS